MKSQKNDEGLVCHKDGAIDFWICRFQSLGKTLMPLSV